MLTEASASGVMVLVNATDPKSNWAMVAKITNVFMVNLMVNDHAMKLGIVP